MTTSSDQQSESDKWLGLAAERGVKLVFLQGVDLTDKAHKDALYQQFDISNDVHQQAELLAFVRAYQQSQRQQGMSRRSDGQKAEGGEQ